MLTQVKGQRKYGGPPPNWAGPVPGLGCEVYISQIPRNVYEDRLIPLFQSVGHLYEFRLMMNYNGQNRGFAYARYTNPAAATLAICMLHLYPMEEGQRLYVCQSMEKRQLRLEGLPQSLTHRQLLEILHSLTAGVERVTIRTTAGEKEMVVLVHYVSHPAACRAKALLMPALEEYFGMAIWADWANGPARPRYAEEPPEGQAQAVPPLYDPNSSPLPPFRYHSTYTPPPASTGHAPLCSQQFSGAVGGPAPPAPGTQYGSMPENLCWPSAGQLRWMY